MSCLYYDTRITNSSFHNLSDVTLTYEQMKILALNYKFVPKPFKTTVASALESFDDFARRLRLSEAAKRRRYIAISRGLNPDLEKGQPAYIPKFHIPALEAEAEPLILHVEHALSRARDMIGGQLLDRQSLHIKPNVNHRELNKLLDILRDNNLVALPADKNLGLCVVTAAWYHDQAWKLLLNPSYQEEEPDHETLCEALGIIIDKSRDLLTRQQHKWLREPVHARRFKVPVLKVLPKIHKQPAAGRPIVPTFDTLLVNASAWVDFHIRPFLSRFDWILPDSKTFCRKLLDVRLQPGEEIWLVSGDVVSMYPNIPIEDGILQIATMLGAPSMAFSTLEEAVNLDINNKDELIILLLRLVLQFNYTSFGGRTFHQVIGTAMGTALAPTYANLFLAGYEVTALVEFEHCLRFYGRFIDDTFAIIVVSLDQVLKFQERFGNLHPNMKMEWSQSQLHLAFLDVHVSVEDVPGTVAWSTRREIVTRVFQKSLNAYLYIPWKSCHSVQSKKAWVKGELIRYVRISSREEDFKKMQVLFIQRLRDRGYPGKWLRTVFSEVSYVIERRNALKSHSPSPPWECDSRLYVLKLTHNPVWDSIDLSPIWKTLRDAWLECGLGRHSDRFLASFKKPESLGDIFNKMNKKTLIAYK
ncbi:uncharacterized protein ARMOST_21327 [Armillaria ostoyae]|uniref:Helix-turn-helix domain-containing protein n=1 Tax=Armillaria ostoyae TaxID=47428 RepID=A0A284S9V3_ARMOS|nr:uncharacterized protein ARMOST_21327 [Armillaria ostoyae]